MAQQPHWLRANVVSVERISADVRRIVIAPSETVAAFDPGSHIQIQVQIGDDTAVRSYTRVPADAGQIAVAIKLHPASRGGSRFMWELEAGEHVQVAPPENRFELSWRAKQYLLVAGGIGVTPIYGMAKALVARGASVSMVYGGRNRATMAYVDELSELLGANLHLHYSDDGQRVDLPDLFNGLVAETELYICGPHGMLEAAKTAWNEAGLSVGRLHFEVFGDSGAHAEASFEIEVANQNIVVQVPAGASVLDSLLAAGIDMIYECQRGECGLCAVDLLEIEGEVDHRDVFFSPDEKRENKRMCTCVSRLTSGRALIDVGFRA